MTTFFLGGTAIVLHIFDPVKSLAAVEKYKANVLGQIPALFTLEWRLPDYDEYDLSSLEFALYGGQQVTRQFLDRLCADGAAVRHRAGPDRVRRFLHLQHADRHGRRHPGQRGLRHAGLPADDPRRRCARMAARATSCLQGEVGTCLLPRPADLPGLRERPGSHRRALSRPTATSTPATWASWTR